MVGEGSRTMLILAAGWIVLLPALVVGLAAWRSARGHATRRMDDAQGWR